MGFEKFRRPVLAPGIAVHSYGSPSTSAGSVSGDIDVSDAIRVERQRAAAESRRKAKSK